MHLSEYQLIKTALDLELQFRPGNPYPPIETVLGVELHFRPETPIRFLNVGLSQI